MTLLLIRHGETDAIGKLLAGRQTGWPLNSIGKRQVISLANQLPQDTVQAIYSSPVERCLETAKLLSDHLGLSLSISDDLAEVDFGDWQGRTFDSLNEDQAWRDFNRIRTTTHPPGGERMTEVQSRMIRGIDQIRSRHPDQTVAVISHGDPIRLTIAYFLGIPIDFLQRFSICLASVTAIHFDAGQPQVLYLNKTYEY